MTVALEESGDLLREMRFEITDLTGRYGFPQDAEDAGERPLGFGGVDAKGPAKMLEEGVTCEQKAAGGLLGEPRLEETRQLRGEVSPRL